MIITRANIGKPLGVYVCSTAMSKQKTTISAAASSTSRRDYDLGVDTRHNCSHARNSDQRAGQRAGHFSHHRQGLFLGTKLSSLMKRTPRGGGEGGRHIQEHPWRKYFPCVFRSISHYKYNQHAYKEQRIKSVHSDPWDCTNQKPTTSPPHRAAVSASTRACFTLVVRA